MDVLSMTLLMLVGLFLILIILLQRGRGGGLAGAFGGMGGQSAFGTKAGDVFTKITVVVATIWVALAGLSGFALRAGAEKRYPGGDNVVNEASFESTEESAAEEEESTTEEESPTGSDPIFDGQTDDAGNAENDDGANSLAPLIPNPNEAASPGGDESSSEDSSGDDSTETGDSDSAPENESSENSTDNDQD